MYTLEQAITALEIMRMQHLIAQLKNTSLLNRHYTRLMVLTAFNALDYNKENISQLSIVLLYISDLK